MKINKSTIWSLIVLITIASLYRIIPNRVPGFAPQIAMAIFAGSIIKDKRYAFLLPLISMLVSDFLYQILYNNNLSNIPGFYAGQWVNYAIFCALTIIGFFVNKNKLSNIIGGSIIGASAYFLVSNFLSWTNGVDILGVPYTKSWEGIFNCYNAALPFYKISLLATLIFSSILFGAYFLINNVTAKKIIA